MKILAIETSCDETAVAVLEGSGEERAASFRVLGNALHSQIAAHREFGGVFPALAKREHAKYLTPTLSKALTEAGLAKTGTTPVPEGFAELLAREHGLANELSAFLASHAVPDIDAIAVTRGPGLEPALWVGINFAKALALAWGKPLVPVNHMEGHLLVSLLAEGEAGTLTPSADALPVLGLLISGGHTELILMKEWLSYELLGQTRDDAVGEAFDKVARMLELPYPGGPEISRLAEAARKDPAAPEFSLPRPMLDTDDFDFSFSGLKTAVLYLLKKRPLRTTGEKAKLAQAFEDAVTEVLWKKTARALRASGARTLVIGGGVSANMHIRRFAGEHIAGEFPGVSLSIPDARLTGDNAVMIAIAGYHRALRREFGSDFSANGTLALA